MTRRRKFLLVICFLLWFQFMTTVNIVKVSGESMNNTLRDGGYYVEADKEYTGIERFDIVVIDSEDIGKYIIKRVVGLPGETVNIKDNQLYINDEIIEQDFNFIETESPEEMTYTLGENEYFVLGDNRPNSKDSRYIGPIKYEEIESVLINNKY